MTFDRVLLAYCATFNPTKCVFKWASSNSSGIHKLGLPTSIGV